MVFICLARHYIHDPNVMWIALIAYTLIDTPYILLGIFFKLGCREEQKIGIFVT